MNVRTILNKTATATALAGMLAFAGACAHHDSVASGDNDYGRVAQNQPATSVSDNGVTPIPGPVKVDSTGASYTSSAAPGNGNSAAVGTNTNVQIIPKTNTSNSSVTYSEAQNTAPAPTVVETPVVTAPTTTETTTTETTTTTVPMTSSTTTVETTPAPALEETTTTTTTEHKRMRKD